MHSANIGYLLYARQVLRKGDTVGNKTKALWLTMSPLLDNSGTAQ